MKKAFLASILLIGSVVTSFAQEKGEWRVRLRATAVVPQESATISAIGGDINISSTVIPELDFTYFFYKNISANLILGTSKHTVKAEGTALGNADLGKVWLLPPTLTLLYHFPVANGILPYAGAGVNYTIFYGVKNGPAIAKTSYDNRFGFATQIGTDVNITKRVFLNLDAKKVWLNTDATVTTIPTVADGATVVAKTKINPWLFSVGVGYKF